MVELKEGGHSSKNKINLEDFFAQIPQQCSNASKRTNVLCRYCMEEIKERNIRIN